MPQLTHVTYPNSQMTINDYKALPSSINFSHAGTSLHTPQLLQSNPNLKIIISPPSPPFTLQKHLSPSCHNLIILGQRPQIFSSTGSLIVKVKVLSNFSLLLKIKQNSTTIYAGIRRASSNHLTRNHYPINQSQESSANCMPYRSSSNPFHHQNTINSEIVSVVSILPKLTRKLYCQCIDAQHTLIMHLIRK